MDSEKIKKHVQTLCCHIQKDKGLQKKLPDAPEAREEHEGNMGAIIVDTALNARNDYDKVGYPAAQEAKAWKCCSMSEVRAKKNDFVNLVGSRGSLRSRQQKIFTGLLERVPAAVETVQDACEWLSDGENRHSLRSIYGVGPKTADYFYQRCGGDILIPDTHIIGYINEALGENFRQGRQKDYDVCQRIGSKAARQLKIPPRKLDAAIWKLKQS